MEAARKTAGQNASFVGPRGEMKRDAPYYTCDGKVNLRLREGDDIVEKEKLSNKLPVFKKTRTPTGLRADFWSSREFSYKDSFGRIPGGPDLRISENIQETG
eukprot:gene13233-biopygen1424